MSSGQKFDGGKLEIAEFFSQFIKALKGLCTVAQYGKIKYSEGNGNVNFKEVPDCKKRYKDAMLRHVLDYLDGKYLDEESKCPHLYHILWNAAVLSEVDEEGTTFDINEALDKERIHDLINKQLTTIEEGVARTYVCNEPSCEHFANGATRHCYDCAESKGLR